MMIDKFTLAIDKKETGYVLKVFLEGYLKNYIHTKPIKELDEIIKTYDAVINKQITLDTLEVVEDDGYYRIKVKILSRMEIPVIFHSRKLNLADLMYERGLLLT